MLRALPLIVALVLAVYCVVDVLQTEARLLRPLGRLGWLAVVLLVPIVGPLVWILTARMRAPSAATPAPRMVAPEDDPEFMRKMREERAKRMREQRSRDQDGSDGDGPPPA